MISQVQFDELIRLAGDRLFHRESRTLEFKEQFNLNGLADYFRDFAAFANSQGGVMIFGVTDKPRFPAGLSAKSIHQFEKIDAQTIDGHLLEYFSSSIQWEQVMFQSHGKSFGVIEVAEATVKPIIAKKNESASGRIRDGEIYFRYSGRSQRISSPDLQEIIEKRVEENSKQWMSLLSKIAQAGPQNAAILDTERGVLEKSDRQILVLDQELVRKIQFVREGEFVERNGATALRIVGDVARVNQVEVPRDITDRYPLSATEVADEVKARFPTAGRNRVWRAIAELGLKDDREFSTYSFRTRTQREQFEEHGVLPKSPTWIYTHDAVDVVVDYLRS